MAGGTFNAFLLQPRLGLGLQALATRCDMTPGLDDR